MSLPSRAWYEANSFCWESDGPQHKGTPVETLGGERVGYICTVCFNAVCPVRRGSDLWIAREN